MFSLVLKISYYSSVFNNHWQAESVWSELLPFSFQEACKADQALTPDTFMLQGGYPRIYDTRMPLNLFFSNYIDTYIERDVSEYLDVRNLADFRRFLTLCALSSGHS